MTEKDERWYVQFDSSDVRLMTLEELDNAFEAGEIHEKTYVIQVGETEWRTLGEVAGIDEEEEAPAEPEAPAHVAASMPPAAPQPVAQTMSAAPAPAVGFAPTMNAMPAPVRTQTIQAPASPVAVAAGGWPPVTTAAPVASPFAPAMSRPSGGIESTIPVVQDVDYGLDARSFKRGRRSAVIAALVALPVLGGAGYGLVHLDAPPASAAAAAAPAAPPVQTANPWKPPPSTETAPTPSTTSTASTSTTSASSDSASSGSSNRLSEDMKKALLAQDESRPTKGKSKGRSKSSTKATSHHVASGKKGGDVFRSGGSKDDPLNSKL